METTYDDERTASRGTDRGGATRPAAADGRGPRGEAQRLHAAHVPRAGRGLHAAGGFTRPLCRRAVRERRSLLGWRRPAADGRIPQVGHAVRAAATGGPGPD